ARALLAGPGVDDTNDSAIIRIVGTDVQLVAREGDQVPGLPADTFYQLFNAPNSYITADGAVVFSGFLGGSGSTGGNDAVVARFDDAGTTIILRKGTAVPGLPGGTTLETVGGNMGVSPSGATAQRSFTSDMVPDFQMTAIVHDSAGDGSELQALARVRGPAPGFPGMTIFWLDSVPQVDGHGRVVFPAVFGDLSGYPFTGQFAVFAGDASGVAPIAADGWGSAHFPSGVTYSTQQQVKVNRSGDVSFVSFLQPAGDRVVLVQRSGADPAVALRTGDPAPDSEPGTMMESISTMIAPFSDTGRVLANVSLTDQGAVPSNRAAIILAGPGFSRMLARSGDAARGQPAGVVFEGLGAGRLLFAPRDRVVFRAVLSNGARALYLGAGVRDPEPLLTEGDRIDVSGGVGPTDERTISSIEGAFAVNRADQVAVEVRFDDGTSAVVLGQLPTVCVPDTNLDGMVSPSDFNAWIIAFN
ncbi:MAG: choice-of-anchor tandem repeat NxxGxxAF-containing protein, partial [Planctomycetota bacterium]